MVLPAVEDAVFVVGSQALPLRGAGSGFEIEPLVQKFICALTRMVPGATVVSS